MKRDIRRSLLSFVALVVLTTGCTKQRDAEIKDQELAAELIEISALKNKEYAVRTDTSIVGDTKASKMRAVNEKGRVKIISTTAPQKISQIFKGVDVSAGISKDYPIRLVLNKDALNVLKVVSDDKELTAIEKQGRIIENKRSLVPMFNIKVDDYGVVCRVKDDNGDETTKLELCHTEFEHATHVRLSLVKNNRNGFLNQDEAEELFLSESINGKVMNLKELKAQLDISLIGNDDPKVISRVLPGKGSKVDILIYKIAKKSNEKGSLEKLSADMEIGELTQCSADVLKQLSEAEQSDCALLLYLKLEATAVATNVKTRDEQGNETLRVAVEEIEASEDMSLIRIAKKTAVEGYQRNEDLEHLFLSDRMNGLVLPLVDLKSQLNVSLEPVDSSKVVSYTLPGKGSSVDILIYKLIKKSDIKDEKLLKKLASDVAFGEIAYCPKAVLKQLPAEDQADCVMVLSFQLEGKAVSVDAKLVDDSGNRVLQTEIKPIEAAKDMKLIQIEPKTAVKLINPRTLGALNPYNTILISNIRGHEFLLRRTFEDGASSIMVFGPGASAAADIVRFEMEDNRIVVRRATSVNGDKKADAFDREELMSIPVKYMGVEAGSDERNPNLIDATKETAKYVVLDWTNNTLPVLNSPLSYFENGQCFNSVGNQSVTDLDNRIKDGVLSFSISGTYSFRTDCMSWYGLNDYWYGAGLQGAFNIKERVSFKLHTKELDTKGLDLPFRAQNLMNFGVFTAGERKPDDFGNQGKVDTELSHPVIHDFSDGKTFTYSLGGLPASGWMRDALISGTREVVAEWNDGLRKAFVGTPLERSGDYILLKIDGVDQEPGRLGDLDRNYIWNFEKNLDSGLLGMSQAAPNPRSGRIEQNNVLMYSGNLLSNIGSQRELARLQKEYTEMKAAALKQLEQQAMADLAAKGAATPANTDPEDTTGGLNIENGKQMMKKLAQIQFVQQPQNQISILKAKPSAVHAPANLKSKIRSQVQALARTNSTDLAGIVGSWKTDRTYLEKIFRKAVEMDATRDELTLQAISSAEVLKAFGSRLTPEQKNTLALQSRLLALKAEFVKNFSKGPNCALVARPYVAAGEADPKLLDDAQTPEVFKSWYKSTLLHEVGHSLGLTHNFKGSLDAKNFAFKDEKTDRNYSSIMDYIPDTFLKYQGPGPYDVRALRVAYTGMVELTDEAATALKGSVKLLETGSFSPEISLADFKKLVLGDKSWWDLDASFKSKIQLKPYEYCTDKDTGLEPTCNRWDLGVNETEVAQFYADEYKMLYPTLNSRGSKIKARDFGSYIGRVTYELFALRPFLEETYYRLIMGMDYQSTLGAAIEARNTFVEIVNTPNVNLPYSSLERFQLAPTRVVNEKGEPVMNPDGTPQMRNVLIERKPIQDIAVTGMPELTDTRGMEIDKVLALMMLTQRDNGNPRYQSISLRVSFVDLEMAMGAQSPLDSLALLTLSNILMDQPLGIASTGDGGLMALPPSMQPQTSELVRYYAALSAGVYLDADAIEDKYNFGTLFRVASSQKSVPGDRPVAAKLDQNLASPGSLKFWALDNATLASEMVKSAAQKRIVIENSDKLVAALGQGHLAKAKNDAAAMTKSKADAVELLKSLNVGGILVSAEDEAAGLTIDRLYDAALQFMDAQVQQSAQIAAMLKQMGVPLEMYEQIAPQITADMKAEVAVTTKSVAIFGAAQKAVLALYPTDKDTPNKPVGLVLASYLEPQVLESNHGIVVNNLQFLNQILSMVHPEMDKFQ